MAVLALVSIALAGCAGQGEPAPARTLQSSSQGPASGGMARTGQDGGSPADVGVGRPGRACAPNGARACWMHGSKLALICRDGSWEVNTICDDDQRCDTAPGRTLGTCRPIIEACAGQEPGTPFCAGEKLRVCVDLVSFKDDSCEAAAICSDAIGVANCACKVGYTRAESGCVDVDECADDGGGCDESAPCSNTEGAYTCGGCPPGYVGGAEGACTPSLTSLTAGPSGLEPGFSAVRQQYSVAVPITTTSITLNATAPARASIGVGGKRLRSGKTWRSPPLPEGPSEFVVEVSEDELPASRYTVAVQRGLDEPVYVRAHNADASDNFGSSVAISGDTLVVGALNEDGAAKGVDGAADSDAASSAGAVYVFVRGQDGWKQEAYLKASNPATGARFGASVAIAGDTIAVGAPGEASASADGTGTAFGSGAAYVFVRRRGEWSERQFLKATNAGPGDLFGSAVAIEDGAIVVGAPGEASIATGVNGIQNNNAAVASGAAYVFQRGSGDDAWIQVAYLKAAHPTARDAFGSSVAISDGTIVVGANGEDSNATSIDGDGENETAQNSGAVFTFVRDGESWLPDAYFKASANAAGDAFGSSVAISGNTLAVGAPGSLQGNGAVYVFERVGGRWTEQAHTMPEPPAMLVRSGPGDAFGASVRVVPGLLLVGAYGEDSLRSGFSREPGNEKAPNSGAAYLYFRDGGEWVLSDTIKAVTPRANQQFGSRLALSPDTIVIGAMNDGRDALALPAAQPMLGPPASGGVYVFR
jgi:hypothetical protein